MLLRFEFQGTMFSLTAFSPSQHQRGLIARFARNPSSNKTPTLPVHHVHDASGIVRCMDTCGPRQTRKARTIPRRESWIIEPSTASSDHLRSETFASGIEARPKAVL